MRLLEADMTCMDVLMPRTKGCAGAAQKDLKELRAML